MLDNLFLTASALKTPHRNLPDIYICLSVVRVEDDKKHCRWVSIVQRIEYYKTYAW